MHANTPKVPSRKQRKRAMTRHSKAVIRWLIFCFPAGLLMMWSDRCRWSRAAKSGISCFFACAVIAVALPVTLPPERAQGGVQLVSTQPALEIQGPRQNAEDEGAFEVEIMSHIKLPSIIVEPTPTPIPVYVYCNTGGKNYHDKDCRYVKNTSARVTVGTALDAGFTQCKICDAPPEYVG